MKEINYKEDMNTATAVSGDAVLSLNEKNKHDQAYQKIKQWILSGELPAESVLVERHLSEALQLSRTPVRSALQQLTKEGFLINTAGRLWVPRVQIEDVLEIFEIRQVLDILALELFMKNPKEEIVLQMRQTVDAMQEALETQDYLSFVRLDTQFHELYFHNSRNQRLEKIWIELSAQEQRITALTQDDVNRCRMSYQHHAAIMEQIEAGNIKKATSSLRKHLIDASTYHIKKLSRM